MGSRKFYNEDEARDILFGKPGTKVRDKYESELKSYLIGEAIKKVREQKQLTQEQLGEMVGVRRAQISRIENSGNLTFATASKIFKAMGVNVKLDMGGLGQVALW